MSEPVPQQESPRGAPFWVHGFALGVSGAFTALFLLLYLMYLNDDVWQRWAGEALKTTHAFAEALRGSIFRQRANTFSNLAYIYVGAYAVSYAWWDARRVTSPHDSYVVQQPAVVGFFGVACIVLGIGSALMHAAMTPWGHKADVYGMFIVMTALIAMQWARRLPAVSRAYGGPVLAAAAAIVSILLIRYPDPFGGYATIMAGLIAITAVNMIYDGIRRNPKQQARWGILAGTSLALAYYIWNLDKARVFSAPESWLQGHALWHLLTAVSLGAATLVYRTETPRGSGRA
jgi:hypothetical protein